MGQASFDLRVWDAVSHIPFGQLATYGQIAELIGAYGCARQVGWAMRRLPLPSKLPWHRVVNAKGMITMSLSREGSDWMQRQMLIAEGILVDAEGHLPLRRHLWRPQLSDEGLLLATAQEGVSSRRFVSAQDKH